jgi:hypothetical protein
LKRNPCFSRVFLHYRHNLSRPKRAAFLAFD